MAADVAFVPVVRQRLSDLLAQRITGSIEAGEFRSGDQLPSIASMARDFRVASATVREALVKLEARQRVEIRHGCGVFVVG
ncbi:MAG TPA: winged helix-turn-helix domain-containing protein [Gemmatimonadaceae bacterium]